jgi:hypothetical protein
LLVVGVVIAFSIKVLSNRPVAATVETVRAAQGGR